MSISPIVYHPFRLSFEGQNRLMAEEKNIPYVYDDATGKAIGSYAEAKGTPTIGLGLAIDTDEERQLFAPYLNGNKTDPNFLRTQNVKKILEFESILNRKLQDVPAVTQNMFDALFSLAWNTGAYSPVVRQVIDYIQAEDYDSAAHAILNGPRTNKKTGEVMSGLIIRRKREADLFLEGAPMMPISAYTKEKPKEPLRLIPRRATDPVLWVYGAMILTIAGLWGYRYFQSRKIELRLLQERDLPYPTPTL